MSEFTEEARKQKQTFINIQQSIEEQDETYQQPFVHKTMEDAALQTTKTRQELLNEKVSFVTSMMPTKLKSKTDEDLPPKKQGMDSFPPAFRPPVRDGCR